jgi:hypothetical protein
MRNFGRLLETSWLLSTCVPGSLTSSRASEDKFTVEENKGNLLCLALAMEYLDAATGELLVKRLRAPCHPYEDEIPEHNAAVKRTEDNLILSAI